MIINRTASALVELDQYLNRNAVRILREFIDLTRVVTFTGVGKSFGVAQLGASLMQSVGYHASAVHTTDLLHGSLGGVAQIEHNVVIFISHSGKTSEVLSALSAIEQYATGKVITAAVTGNRQSELAERCNIALDYRISADGSNHGTIPTVSVAVQLAIINTLVCDVANLLTAEQLGSYHPGGALHDRYEEKISHE